MNEFISEKTAYESKSNLQLCWPRLIIYKELKPDIYKNMSKLLANYKILGC